MKAKLGQRAVVAFAVASLAGGASALFGGTALAGVHDNDTGGNGGASGAVHNNCVLPIGLNVGGALLGAGDASQQMCSGSSGATGDGGGADY
jgi:hypothetical protein